MFKYNILMTNNHSKNDYKKTLIFLSNWRQARKQFSGQFVVNVVVFGNLYETANSSGSVLSSKLFSLAPSQSFSDLI